MPIMTSAIRHTILLLALSAAVFSCKKKAGDKKEDIKVTTDSLYLQAVVDSLVFTSAATEGLYSGQSSYWIATKSYLDIVARTGPDSTDKTISLRIDNFPHQTGEYIISPSTGGKASYSINNKKTEVADSGKITITHLGETVKGTFYFYTPKHKIFGGIFSAQ